MVIGAGEMKPVLRRVWNFLDAVRDPEIPVLSIHDLGVLRELRIDRNRVTVVITPTYTGCPAMLVIKREIEVCLKRAGYRRIIIETQLSSAWTTDWITPRGQKKLRRYGIAPPQANWPHSPVPCPRCGGYATRVISEFGATACRALFTCDNCLEPFDYFKCL